MSANRGCAVIDRMLLNLVPLLCVLSLVGAAQAQQPAPPPNACGECHKSIAPARDQALAHAKGVTCLTCHHVGMSNDAKQISARRLEVCRGCHKLLQPAHAEVRGEKAPSCTQCHSIHSDASVKQVSLPSERCRSCHETRHVLHANSGSKGPQCADCHSMHDAQPLKPAAAAVSQKCASCHESVHPSHKTASIGASCTSCHKLDDAAAPAHVGGTTLSGTCASCHKDLVTTHITVKKGAPVCTDCHAFAKDQPVKQSSVAISERCGSCHTEQMRLYQLGAHADALNHKQPNGDLPTCVTCHTAHGHGSSNIEQVRLSATSRCVGCHSDPKLARKYQMNPQVGKSYQSDFHGATLAFAAKHPAGKGQPNVMTCADCHGAHQAAVKDPKAVAAVCTSCHEKGDRKLASAWLGHKPASAGNNLIIWAIRVFYSVLIPFMMLGMGLHLVFQFFDQKRKGARMLETENMKQIRAWLHRKERPQVHMVARFSVLERLEHVGAMSTFMLLALTGLPQAKPAWPIAHQFIEMLGGIGMTRIIHRTAGFLFVALLVRHVAAAILRSLRSHKLPIMCTSVQDFYDAYGTVKHFLFGTPRPKTGKFDFSEKFEYWGLFMGGTLMAVTGIALVFPELVTQVLPGFILAAMRTMHGLEATFAVLVIAMWHSYGVILRPEVFPLDTSIFTGKISMHRLEEEHGAEFERLFPDAAEHEQQEEKTEENLETLTA